MRGAAETIAHAETIERCIIYGRFTASKFEGKSKRTSSFDLSVTYLHLPFFQIILDLRTIP